MNPGKRELAVLISVVKTGYFPILDRNTVKTGVIVHCQGNRCLFCNVMAIEFIELNRMINVSVCHQKGFILHIFESCSQTTTGAEDGFLLQYNHS